MSDENTVGKIHADEQKALFCMLLRLTGKLHGSHTTQLQSAPTDPTKWSCAATRPQVTMSHLALKTLLCL